MMININQSWSELGGKRFSYKTEPKQLFLCDLWTCKKSSEMALLQGMSVVSTLQLARAANVRESAFVGGDDFKRPKGLSWTTRPLNSSIEAMLYIYSTIFVGMVA